MKKPQISVLIAVTAVVLAFTLGLYWGRNSTGGPVTLSFPEEMYHAPVSKEDTLPKNLTDDVSFPIDINTAMLHELMALPGIGEGLAGQIIDYRQTHGHFTHTEQLLGVPGIGENRLEAILGLITVGGTE